MSGHGRAPACLPVPAAAEAVPLPRRGIVLWESLRRTLVDLLRGVSRPNNGEVRGAFFRPPFFSCHVRIVRPPPTLRRFPPPPHATT